MSDVYTLIVRPPAASKSSAAGRSEPVSTSLSENFAGGGLTSSVQYDGPSINAANWERIESQYDSAGQLLEQITYYDSGIVLNESFVNGVIASSIKYDDPITQAEEWERIESQYDSNGQLQQQITYFDSGVILDESFVNGVIASSVMYDDPVTQAEDWERIESQYDNEGQLQEEVKFYDDGGVDHTQYMDGIITSRSQYDDPYNGTEEWEQIDSFYDVNGELTEQAIIYDDGVVDYSQYQNGVITSRSQYDDPYNSTEEWEQIDSFYDANGELTEQAIIYDDGVVDYSQYQNGVITSRSQYDDPYNSSEEWEQIDSFYDANGELAQQIILYDNGVVDDAQFYGGTITYRMQHDNPYESAVEWQQVETYYDSTGAVSSDTTFYDDGRITSREFENGQLRVEVSFDDPEGMNLYDWEAQAFEFNTDGQKTLDLTLYDNGDFVRHDFDAGGNLDSQWDLDGDGDQPWLGRKIDYAPDGSELDTTYWYEEDTLPPELTLETAVSVGF